MWHLLTNDMYLYLLINQHKIIKVNCSKLASEVGKTRQTLSKYYKELLDEDMVSEDGRGFIIVNDPFDLTEEELTFIKDHIFKEPAAYIGYYICKKRYPYKTDREICGIIGISHNCLKAFKQDIKNHDSKNYVYGIVYEGIIKYVGSTMHLDMRIAQHIDKRPFLTKDNFIILEECDKINRFDREAFYRQLFKPEWNELI